VTLTKKSPVRVTGRSVTPEPPEALDGGEGGAPTEPFEDDDDAAQPHEDEAPESALRLKVPFGPFLALGALEYLFLGDGVLAFWLG